MRWMNISLYYLIAGHHAGLADWHPSDIDHGLSVRLARPQAKAESPKRCKVWPSVAPHMANQTWPRTARLHRRVWVETQTTGLTVPIRPTPMIT